MIQPVDLFRGDGVLSLIGSNLMIFQPPLLPGNYKNWRYQSYGGWLLALQFLAQGFPCQATWGVGPGTTTLSYRREWTQQQP